MIRTNNVKLNKWKKGTDTHVDYNACVLCVTITTAISSRSGSINKQAIAKLYIGRFSYLFNCFVKGFFVCWTHEKIVAVR